MASKTIIELGGRRYNADWLRLVSETQAVIRLRGHCDVNQVRNAWKQANGKSVRNYSEPAAKPVKNKAPKRTRKEPRKQSK